MYELTRGEMIWTEPVWFPAANWEVERWGLASRISYGSSGLV
jgi:hypothetical protein